MINLVSPLKYLYDKLNLRYTDDTKYNKLIKEYLKGDGAIKEYSNRIIFMCNGRLPHGGLTDRLCGILTTYYLAKKNNKPFFINWVSPFKLENYLEPNSYDWRIDDENINYDVKVSDLLVFSSFNPKLYWKRNVLSYLIFRKWLCQKGREKHVYTNFYFPKSRFPKLYNELFKPSELLLSEVNKHLIKLGSHYWSFSFRFCCLLGDFKDITRCTLDVESAQELINNNIKELKLLMAELPVGYKCLITSDSQIFLKNVASIDPRIYIVPGPISHIDVDNSTDHDWLKLFIDQNLIMKAEKVFLLKTGDMYKSRFAEFAALIGEKEFIYHIF